MKQALKFTLGIVALAATLGIQSCDKIKDNVKISPFDYTGASADIIIPPTAAGSGGDLATGTISVNIDSLISDETQNSPIKVKYSDISTITITSMVLTLSDADVANNFGNFQTAGGTFNTDANGGSLEPYTIAYIDPNPATFSGELDMPLADKDKNLKPYFADGKVQFTYAVTGKLRTATTHTLHCHVEVTYTFTF